MIKTKALEKAARFLKNRKITESDFELKDDGGHLQAWKKGVHYEITIKHDDAQVKVKEEKTRWL